MVDETIATLSSNDQEAYVVFRRVSHLLKMVKNEIQEYGKFTMAYRAFDGVQSVIYIYPSRSAWENTGLAGKQYRTQ